MTGSCSEENIFILTPRSNKVLERTASMLIIPQEKVIAIVQCKHYHSSFNAKEISTQLNISLPEVEQVLNEFYPQNKRPKFAYKIHYDKRHDLFRLFARMKEGYDLVGHFKTYKLANDYRLKLLFK